MKDESVAFADRRYEPIAVVLYTLIFLVIATLLNVGAWSLVMVAFRLAAIVDDPTTMAGVCFTICQVGIVGLFLVWGVGKVKW